jgi:hypothetical protein
MKMQEVNWKVFVADEVMINQWGTDMLFEYTDDEGATTLQWFQGRVVELIRQTGRVAIGKIEWNADYVCEGGASVTKEHLKRSKWNIPNIHLCMHKTTGTQKNNGHVANANGQTADHQQLHTLAFDWTVDQGILDLLVSYCQCSCHITARH